MSVIVWEVYFSCTAAANVVSRVLLDFKLVQTQSKRVHKDGLQKLNCSLHHDVDSFATVVGLKNYLAILDCEV